MLMKQNNSKISDNPSILKIINDAKSLKKFQKMVKMRLFDVILNDENKNSILKAIDWNEIDGYIEAFNCLDKFNDLFLDNGWVAHESMNHKIMKEAVEIAVNKNVDDGDKYLVEAYGDEIKELKSLLIYPEELNSRSDLINLAYDDYINERYHSCILLLFVIIDGFVADTKISENKGFFAEGEDIYA